MKFVSKDTGVAAAEGTEAFRVRARRSVALGFLKHSVWGVQVTDWDTLRRLLQCIDYQQPVVTGPGPAAPSKLFPLTTSEYFASGYFADAAPDDTPESAWWEISPKAEYLKFCLPKAKPTALPSPRYLIPSMIRRVTK